VTTTNKILTGLLITEAALTAYFFYAQPQCEPCQPFEPCHACIGEGQIVTFWTGFNCFSYKRLLDFHKLSAKKKSVQTVGLLFSGKFFAGFYCNP